MVNQQLLNYIKQQLQQGVSREIITNNLISQGWQQSDVNEGFSSIDSFNTSSQISSPQSFSTLPQQPERKGNKTLLAIISIIGALIIGSGVFGYFYYFQETPEKVIEKMRTRLTEVKTLEYQGDVKTEFTTGWFSDFSVNFSGKSDVSDLNNPKGSFESIIGADDIFLAFELRNIGKIIYFKLSNIPYLELGLEFSDISFIDDQWIKTNIESLKKPFWLENFEEQIKEEQKQQELTPEQIEKLKQIVAQTKVFKVTEKLASEEIEGVNTHHYKFSIDKNELRKLIVNIIVIVENKTLTEGLVEFDRTRIMEKLESLNGEIWIGKKDLLPYKISFEALMITSVSGFKIPDKDKFMLMISFKNYDKPVKIDIPSPVKSLEEILVKFWKINSIK